MSQNSYKNVYIPSEKIVKLSRTYTKAKSLPLTRTFIQVSNPVSSSPSLFVAVFYQASAVAEKEKFHATEMPPKTLNHIFGRPKMLEKNAREKAREKCVNGLNAKTVYGEINRIQVEYIIRLHKAVNYETSGKYTYKRKGQN